MDKLGPNLEYILTKSNKKYFSLKTSLMIYKLLLYRLMDLHQCGYIHRDLKPENIVIGPIENNKDIYLIDFGLSKRFINNKGEHIQMKDKQPIVGTLRYISINMHKQLEQSRRDDLESLLYVIIYFILGDLPWMNIKTKTRKEKYTKIYQIKCNTVPDILCNKLPEEFKKIFDIVLKLEFTERPNYDSILTIIQQFMNNYGFKYDLLFDWNENEVLYYILLFRRI